MAIQNAPQRIPFGRPVIGEEERQAELDVLAGSQLVHGPRSKAFEQGFAARLGPEAAATSVASCTAGLHLVYMHLGIGTGDEVIVPAQTHVATAHAVEITGARPVFVDCERTTGNIDPDALAAAITSRTRAISVVHYLGLPVAMDAVMDIARARNHPVIEDCALAIGGAVDGVACGLIGDVGVFSFYPVKHMTTAEGGMVAGRDHDLIRSVERLKAFGYDRMLGERKVPGVYDVVALGLNYRMNELEAAIGIEQLRRLDGFDAARRRNAAALRTALAGVPRITVLADGDARHRHANYCLAVVLDDDLGPRRPEIIERMAGMGIGTSVYYPGPVPHMTYYRQKYGISLSNFPEARRISLNSIALPVGPHLAEHHMREVAAALSDVIRELPA